MGWDVKGLGCFAALQTSASALRLEEGAGGFGSKFPRCVSATVAMLNQFLCACGPLQVEGRSAESSSTDGSPESVEQSADVSAEVLEALLSLIADSSADQEAFVSAQGARAPQLNSEALVRCHRNLLSSDSPGVSLKSHCGMIRG